MGRGLVLICALLSACASVDPHYLQIVRSQCDDAYPPVKTSAKDYYNCVQGAEPFGAYLENEGKAEETGIAIPASVSKNFSADIDFINKAPKEDRPWLMAELALEALSKNNVKLASQLLGQTAKQVETIYGDSAQAKKARSLFRQEAEKLFIGESHERAMVFHYLGLADLMQGDYQNARASFASAVLQDSLAGKEEHQQDFASAVWLQGWAARCAGSRQATSLFRKAKDLLSLPAPSAKDDLIVVAELGRGPFKVAQGGSGEKLSYRTLSLTPLEQKFQPAAYSLYVANDLIFQATTRGDRSFDEYLAEKATTKKDLKTAATIGAYTGLILMDAAANHNSGAAALAGGAVLLASGIAALVSSAANVMADVRTVRGLPRSIYVGSFNTKVGSRNFKRFFRYIEQNKRAGRLSYVYSKGGRCSILWVKDISYKAGDE